MAFKLNDSVKVISRTSDYYGLVGKISFIRETGRVCVLFTAIEDRHYFDQNELKLVNSPPHDK